MVKAMRILLGSNAGLLPWAVRKTGHHPTASPFVSQPRFAWNMI